MSLQTNFPRINQKISIEAQQQASIAYLGQLALSEIASKDLAKQAVAVTIQALPVETVMIWELKAGGKSLSLKAGSSWKNDLGGSREIPLDPNSLEYFTLLSSYPIVIENLKTETRFQPLTDYLEQGMTSGLSVMIGTDENPCGFFEVFSAQTQLFSQTDLFFIQSVANILAFVMEKQRQELRHSDQERYEIKNRLNESRERERLRLAQELHDVPIQDLYGLIYQLDDLKDVLQSTEGEKIVDDFNQTLHRVVNNLRTTCRELRPPSLSPFGLEVAIRDHVEKFRDQNPEIEVHLELMRDQQVLSDSLRLSLFRIYQQAINNVSRHAQARDVYIRFRWDDNTIILEVEDNGRGFEIPKHWVELVRKEHFGLVGIAERVESIGGKLEIVSALGNGTLIRAIVPRH